MLLRPYQAATLAEVQNAYASRKRRVLLCSPTGSGKSAMTGHMLERTKKRTLILCHRAELMGMISKALPVRHSLILPGKPTPQDRVLVGMVQTVQRRLKDLPSVEWVISDECHLALADGWKGIIDHYDKAWHLGMSATPCRLDGKGLGAIFETIVYGPSIRELVARGFLVQSRIFAPPFALDRLRVTGGDYNMDDAAGQLNKPSITGLAVEQLRKHGPKRRTIVYCCTVEHAIAVAHDFRLHGFDAAHIEGSMTGDQRDRLLSQFRDGRLQVLVNVELLTTGLDLPMAEAGVFLRPTKSLALYLQMIGRFLRIHPGKTDALILDHVGNIVTHGLPDEDREWTLDGRPKRSAAVSVRTCPQCYACHRPQPKCPACGHVYAAAGPMRQPPKVKAGDLVEIDPARAEHLKTAKLRDLLAEAKTKSDLQAIAKAKGYHHRWVLHAMQNHPRIKDDAA